jgi:hypothetical protein
MPDLDFYELSVEQEEYLVELLCTGGACTLDLLARELDELCRENAAYSSTSPSSVADCASRSSLSVK